MELELHLKKTVNENANIYFDNAKKLKKKIYGIDKIIESKNKQLEDFENKKERYLKQKQKQEKIKIHKKKQWYEKFRYTFTSNGFLVIIGKDAGTNEILIKKHTQEKDIVMHTEAKGSPFGIIKSENKEVPKLDIEEAAQFICCFSAQWKKGFGTADAFWVLPNQVSKTAQSGEFMSRGSFMIRGKKNILKNITLKICLGIIKSEIKTEDETFEIEELFSGSEEACKRYCKTRFIKIEPGQDNYKKLTKEIKKRLKCQIEDLPKFIPNNCKILKR